MKRRGLVIWVIVLLVVFAVILISAPKLINTTFERATRIMEQNFLKEAPPEYETRITVDFDHFISAFKENKIQKKDLEDLSNLVKGATEDKKLTHSEIDEILTLIETITPGLK